MSSFHDLVALRFDSYNRLFLSLPFETVRTTGELVPLLSRVCDAGYKRGLSPQQILDRFREESASDLNEETFTSLLFRIVQYVERQVVLFDAVEDAAFESIHELGGAGSVERLVEQEGWRGDDNLFRERLKSFQLRIVLTAHPTQFYPDAVLGILTDLEKAIRSDDLQIISELLMQLGRTPFMRRRPPTPYDEAESLVWYLRNVFYDAIPDVIRSVAKTFAIDQPDTVLTHLIQLGFWPGGDRDGNPNVTVEITRAVASLLRTTILEAYQTDVRVLQRRLTFRGVSDHIAAIANRLTETILTAENGYPKAASLIKDLEQLRFELDRDHAHLFSDMVTDLLIRVRCFGFHFASIDIRQDRSVILSASAGKRDEREQDFIETLALVKELQEEFGEQVVHRVIISNTRSEAEVLAVYEMAREAGWEEPFRLDIIPLFETIPDLQGAADIMCRLLTDQTYRSHVQARGNRQSIMVGFSDGTKDGGFLAANWYIYKAKEEISAAVEKMGVSVSFFDGRGGPPARGGGKTHAYYASLGPRVANDEIQVTIQGQTITSNFGTVQAASYNIEQLLTAGLGSHTPDMGDGDRDTMNTLAKRSLEKYRSLKDDPSFTGYLKQLGPLDYYGATNIGSRPTRRGPAGQSDLSSLRAIPFVGTWYQMKQNVPGYYGFGTALQKGAQEMGDEALQKLYQRSPLLQALVANSMMALTKCFFPLTSCLQTHAIYGSMWNDIHEEYNRSIQWLLRISAQSDLMSKDEAGKASIELREQIILPLLTIQQFALLKVNENAPGLDTWRKLVVRSMYGIINAGRNVA